MPKFCRTSLLMFSCIQLQQQSVSFISPSFDQMLGLKMDCIFLEVFTLVPQFGQTFVPLFNFYHSSYNTYFFVLKLQLLPQNSQKLLSGSFLCPHLGHTLNRDVPVSERFPSFGMWTLQLL